MAETQSLELLLEPGYLIPFSFKFSLVSLLLIGEALGQEWPGDAILVLLLKFLLVCCAEITELVCLETEKG
jgi:uncharacterized membrane protein